MIISNILKISLICFSGIYAVAPLNATAVEIVAIPQSTTNLIYSHEAEEQLQLKPESSLEKALAEFTAKKGTLIRLEGDARPFQFLPGDMVFPACSAGFNRSQTTWALLKPYEGKIILKPPHSTRYGFDPYNGKINWHRANKPIVYQDEFSQWAGFPKSHKFGWDVFSDWVQKTEATAEELLMMSRYYDREYYNPVNSKGSRRIYIAFAKNAHVHLYRLCQTNESLENVIVLFYPLEDLIQAPLPEWGTRPKSVQSYTKFSELLKPYLDFNRLKT